MATNKGEILGKFRSGGISSRLSYIKYLNEKDATSLSMLFAENGIQSVDSKEGVVIGREKIGTSQMFSEGQVLNANILGYKYLGNSLAIAFNPFKSFGKHEPPKENPGRK